MLTLQNIFYLLPNKDVLFSNINLTINSRQKVALIGNNGVGKSTLLKLVKREIYPSDGQINVSSEPYHVPQIFGQFDELSIAQALGIDLKLNALKNILAGSLTEANYLLLADDWLIEERCIEALQHWGLAGLNLNQKLASLSGGQKTKVYLAGINVHQPKLVLLDEPSNHLDLEARKLLYDFINKTNQAVIAVSHDRILLDLMDTTCVLKPNGIAIYPGNYSFYATQKALAQKVLSQDIQNKETALRKAREKEMETAERQQKLDARGKKKQEKAGVSRIMMNTLRNNAENSTAKAKSLHDNKIGSIANELKELRSALPEIDQMKFGFEQTNLHLGKILFTADGINYGFEESWLWENPINLQIRSGQRLALKGRNGVGKTTLIKIVLNQIEVKVGSIQRYFSNSIYIDQDYKLINQNLNVYEQAQSFNHTNLQEHEVKIRLNRFLFGKEQWLKPCGALSGGERMRLILCCLTIANQAPDLIILDEPTNNLDLQNIEILTHAIVHYQGTLIVVSHDETFLEQVGINAVIQL